MNITKRALHILLPVLILTVVSLGCGFLTPPTPTPEPTNTPEPTDTPIPTETPVPTPTSTPTPTPIPLPEMASYTNDNMGLTMDYPADWHMEEEEAVGSNSVIFATQEDFEPGDEEGAVFGVIAIPLGGLEISGIEELWDSFAEEMSGDGVEIGEPEPFPVGGEDGVRGTYESTEDDFYGWVVMAFVNDQGYAFLVITSPTEAWADYEPTFDEMFASVEFFEPDMGDGGDGGDGGAVGGTFVSREDIPIPDDADIQLDMTAMLSYLTEASIVDTATFCEENWPDYGWTANKDDILYTITEETGLLFFSKGAETALVAVTIDDDTGKTMVSIIISEE